MVVAVMALGVPMKQVKVVSSESVREPVVSPRPADQVVLRKVVGPPDELAWLLDFGQREAFSAEELAIVMSHFDIGVLDSQDERAAGSSGQQPVEESRTGVAHMQMAGRTGSKSDSHETTGATRTRNHEAKSLWWNKSFRVFVFS
jgi:hypothetical protein